MGCQTPETQQHTMTSGPGSNGEINCSCGTQLATFAQFAEHVEHQLDKGNVLTNTGVLTTHADANPTNGLERFLAAGLPAMMTLPVATNATLADTSGEPMVEFKSGARRSQKAPRYDLIPAEGLRRLAERYTMGAAKYGDCNWQKGLKDPEYVNQFKAHLLAHWVAYLEDGCAKDDNLSAIAWGAFALMEAEKAARQ